MKSFKRLLPAALALLLMAPALFAQDVVTNTTVTTVAQTATPSSTWIKVKADYQTTFTMDMEDELGFNMSRARIGAAGSLFKNMYFEIALDGKYTQRGGATELRKAFLSWEFLPGHAVTMGAFATTFARGLSGTEFAFISYDITESPDSYQYGVGINGVVGDKLRYYLAACNGEGLDEFNTGKGLLYMGRVEFTPIGKWDMVDGAPTIHKTPSLTVSGAAAYDNKSQTPDNGLNYEYYGSMHFLADLTFKINGFSFFAQGNLNKFDQKEDGSYWGGANKNAKQTMGGFAQIGYNMAGAGGPAIEPMVKYEYWRTTVNEGFGDTDYDVARINAGINWYLKGHDLKLNVEYRYTMKDDNIYFIKEPSKHFVGFRLTHKFASKKISL